MVHIHTEREGSESTINLAMAQHDRDPSSVMVENLMQYSGDLNNLGDIAFTRRTVQRKRCFTSKSTSMTIGASRAGRITITTTTRNECYAHQNPYTNLCVCTIITIRYITRQGPKHTRMVQKMTSEAAIRNAGECLMVAL